MRAPMVVLLAVASLLTAQQAAAFFAGLQRTTGVISMAAGPTAGALTIIKHVVNDDGGTASAGDWTMDISATNPSGNHFPGSEAGVTITLDLGDYSVDESGGPSGYEKTLSPDCSGSIAMGETKTCRITNDDVPPSPNTGTVVIVKNAVGGDGMFSFTGSGEGIPPILDITTSGGTGTTTFANIPVGVKTVTETGLSSDWAFSSLSCDDPDGGTTWVGQAATIDVDAGETVTCSFTNQKPESSADLAATVIGSPNPVAVGNNLTYTISVTNNGPARATGVALTDALPPAVSYLDAGSNHGTCAGGTTVTCTLGSLAPGASADVGIVVQTLAIGVLENAVSVSGAESDPDTTNNIASTQTLVTAKPFSCRTGVVSRARSHGLVDGECQDTTPLQVSVRNKSSAFLGISLEARIGATTTPVGIFSTIGVLFPERAGTWTVEPTGYLEVRLIFDADPWSSNATIGNVLSMILEAGGMLFPVPDLSIWATLFDGAGDIFEFGKAVECFIDAGEANQNWTGFKEAGKCALRWFGEMVKSGSIHEFARILIEAGIDNATVEGLSRAFALIKAPALAKLFYDLAKATRYKDLTGVSFCWYVKDCY